MRSLSMRCLVHEEPAYEVHAHEAHAHEMPAISWACLS
jgi:hypothetical protein